jgi:hypothetical protein
VSCREVSLYTCRGNKGKRWGKEKEEEHDRKILRALMYRHFILILHFGGRGEVNIYDLFVLYLLGKYLMWIVL